MKRSRFSEEQIIAVLKEQEAGMPTAEVYRAAPGTGTRLVIVFLAIPTIASASLVSGTRCSRPVFVRSAVSVPKRHLRSH